MAETLLTYETIDADQIDDIMAGAKPRAPKDWDEPQSPKKKSTKKTPIKGPAEEL
jgi:cell division protease FtsH